ncbi:MAG TPA: haloacid dehalogenase-like hydrolase, partial [Bacilli bacterium]|nr:haloacid dehalogenase-like hydrolase [Bacilli bacterium]
MKINLYDFDETIYSGDSSRDFFLYSLLHYPIIVIHLPIMLIYALLYLLHVVNKTRMKEVIFAFVKYIPNIDEFIILFWDTHSKNIKEFYLNKSHQNDIIISASPEYLLEPICNSLKVKKLIASKVDKKTGKFLGLNCHDKEKVRRLNELYTNY